jgi:hypothetical protein
MGTSWISLLSFDSWIMFVFETVFSETSWSLFRNTVWHAPEAWLIMSERKMHVTPSFYHVLLTRIFCIMMENLMPYIFVPPGKDVYFLRESEQWVFMPQRVFVFDFFDRIWMFVSKHNVTRARGVALYRWELKAALNDHCNVSSCLTREFFYLMV